jgi:hypothetical protein
VSPTTKRRRSGLGRLLPRGVWLLLAVLAILVYRESIPSWVWSLAAGIVVVAAVCYWLGFPRGRRK